MVKWHSVWIQVLYVAMTLMALAIASGAGHEWG
jgi:hypothetical protein